MALGQKLPNGNWGILIKGINAITRLLSLATCSTSYNAGFFSHFRLTLFNFERDISVVTIRCIHSIHPYYTYIIYRGCISSVQFDGWASINQCWCLFLPIHYRSTNNTQITNLHNKELHKQQCQWYESPTRAISLSLCRFDKMDAAWAGNCNRKRHMSLCGIHMMCATFAYFVL